MARVAVTEVAVKAAAPHSIWHSYEPPGGTMNEQLPACRGGERAGVGGRA